MSCRAILLASGLIAAPALSASAQVIDFIDHWDAAQHVGEVAVVTGPVARVQRLPDGTLRLALGVNYAKRTIDVLIPPLFGKLFGGGEMFQRQGVQVRGLIALDSTRSPVPFIILAEDGKVEVVDRSSVSLTPPSRSVPVESISLTPADSRWTLTFSPGIPLGGPVGQMKARLLENDWTERYCDFKQTTCHDNPLVHHASLAITGTLSWQLGRLLQGSALFSVVPLGSAEGRRNGIDVRADWSTILVGGTIGITLIPQVQLGAGPVFAILNSERVDNQPRGVLRPGAIFEADLRSSVKSAMFFEAKGSYRLLPSRNEGPWPGRKDAAFVAAGPGTMDANFSHLFLSVGLGMRFTSGVQ